MSAREWTSWLAVGRLAVGLTVILLDAADAIKDSTSAVSIILICFLIGSLFYLI